MPASLGKLAPVLKVYVLAKATHGAPLDPKIRMEVQQVRELSDEAMVTGSLQTCQFGGARMKVDQFHRQVKTEPGKQQWNYQNSFWV